MRTLLPDGPTATWVTPPPLDERLMRRGTASIERLRALLPENGFILVRVLRIDNPPRAIEIELHSVFSRTKGLEVAGQFASVQEATQFEGHCPEIIAIAAELMERWPRYGRPQSLALMTDGKILACNPGRPEARGYAWIEDHLNGESPCALLLGQSDTPFAIPRMALTASTKEY